MAQRHEIVQDLRPQKSLKSIREGSAHQQVGVEAILERPKAHPASVVAQVHDAGVVDAPDMQRLQRVGTVSVATCCKTAGPVDGHSVEQASWLLGQRH